MQNYTFCSCKENVDGRTCNACVAGAYQYPNCMTLNCDRTGTEEGICDQVSVFQLDGLEESVKPEGNSIYSCNLYCFV